MSQVLEIPLEGGGSVRVEVADDSGVERVGRVGDAVRTAGETLQDGLRAIQPAVAAVVSHFRDTVHAPDRLELTFGITVSSTAGIVVAQAATEANFTVTAEWKRTPPPAPTP